LGSYFSISIWILFLEAGFFISLVFLFRKNNFSNSKKRKVTRPPDKWGWGVKINNSTSHNKKLPIIILMFIIFVLSGFIRIESNKLNENEIQLIEKINGQKILFNGKILKSPEIKNGKQKILLGDIKADGFRNNFLEKVNVIIYLERYPEYNIGDDIIIDGKINIPEDFDGFEYKNYLFSKGIYYISYYPQIEIIKKDKTGFYYEISKFRKNAGENILSIFPQPQAGIISAMTLGVKSGISSETLKSFNKTSTRHIIAVSGLHMTIVAVLIMYLLLAIGLKRNHAFYFAILGIVFFVALVGFPPSAVRAAIMGGLVLFAVKVGRLANAANAIIFAGVLMLLYNPNLLRYDVGFQLSFSAVFGIIYIYPRLDFYFKKYPDYLKIKTMFLITISAQIATLPIIINSFSNYSVFSVFANILVLPFVPVVMIGGIISIMAGFVSLLAGQIVAMPISLILSLQLYIINFFAGFNIGYFSFNGMNIWFVAVYYGVLVLLLNFRSIKKDAKIQ
ncbi:MAG: ComEC/Rec2 family competence protein, partial [Candidatus Pacebacteria bacterium]|nr:ComEC/Rec2 family competence protein [Candidatus Paceibacterota bacterium]